MLLTLNYAFSTRLSAQKQLNIALEAKTLLHTGVLLLFDQLSGCLSVAVQLLLCFAERCELLTIVGFMLLKARWSV